MVASALTFLALPTASSSGLTAVVVAGQTEIFLGRRISHSCNQPMVRDTAKGECPGICSDKCPKAKNQPTHPPRRDRKKKSFKDGMNKKVQGAVVKALEEKNNGTPGTPVSTQVGTVDGMQAVTAAAGHAPPGAGGAQPGTFFPPWNQVNQIFGNSGQPFYWALEF